MENESWDLLKRECLKMFKNRIEAGNFLADELHPYKYSSPVILAIPRGGVEVAYPAVTRIACDFSVVVADTLRYPLQEKATFGSLAEDGSLYLDPWVRIRLNREMINKSIERERNEIKRRTEIYRQGKSLPDLTGRTVIVIDEGVAAGGAMFVTLTCLRKKNPGKLIVATPVADQRLENKLTDLADEVIILVKPGIFYSVSQVYEEHKMLADLDVLQRIKTINHMQRDTASHVTKRSIREKEKA